MNKVCLIYQPCGLGDILFLQKFAHIQKAKGYEIYWPVIHEFEWLNEHIPDFHFVSWDDKNKPIPGPPLPDHIQFPYKEKYNPASQSIFTENFIFFNGFTPILHNKLVMAYKYEIAQMKYNDWRDYVKFNRNPEKENYLYYDVLGLKDNEPYAFINRKFQIRPYIRLYNRIPNNKSYYNKRVVEMDILNGYTLFDWCKVIENACEIHMIATSLNFVMESKSVFPNIKTNNLFLYSRDRNFREVNYLFNIKWNYII